MPRKKLTIEELFDARMEETRERMRTKPAGVSETPLDRARAAVMKGLKPKLPKLPKI